MSVGDVTIQHVYIIHDMNITPTDDRNSCWFCGDITIKVLVFGVI